MSVDRTSSTQARSGGGIVVTTELWLVLAAIGAAVFGQILLVNMWASPTAPGLVTYTHLAALAIGNVIAPWLLVAAVLLLMGRLGLIRRGRLVVAGALTIAALATGPATMLAISRGMDEADGLAPRTLFADLVLAFWGTGIILGAAAITVVLTALFHRIGLSSTLSLVVSLAAGLVGAPALGLAFSTPAGVLLLAIGFAVVVVVLGRRRRTTGAVDAAAPASASRAANVGTTPVVLAALAAVLGSASAVFALTGSTWPTGTTEAPNGTQAMGYGLAAGLVCAVPLIIAIALAASRRRPSHPLFWSTWAPTGLLSLAAFCAAASSVQSAVTDGAGSLLGWNLLAVALALVVLGVACVVGSRLPVAGIAGRVAASVLIAAGISALIGASLFAVGFVAPVLALVLAAWVFPRMNRGASPAADVAAEA